MKIILILFITVSFAFVCLAQISSNSGEQTKMLEEINNLNQQMVQLYKERKLDEALSVGKKIQDLANSNNLNNDARLLVPFTNTAEIYLAKSKEAEAIPLLETVSGFYEKMGEKGRAGYEKTLSRLAYAHTMKKDYKTAETQFLKLKSLNEAAYGEKSRQSANTYLQLGNLYNLMSKDSDAEMYLQKAILINDDILSEKEKEVRADEDLYTCSVYHRTFKKGDLKNINTLFDEFNKKRGILADDYLKAGIVNSKAKNLAIPQYPYSARSKRASGFALAKVDIDEQGNVIKAKGFCGFMDFVDEVEKAAMKSKFTPTLMNGVPVKVKGMIVYNFIAQ